MSNVSVDKPQARCKPEDLHVANIDEKSHDYDWGENQIGDDWELVCPDFGSYSRKLLLLYARTNNVDLEGEFGDVRKAETEQIASFLGDHWNEEGEENPMMNYYYPAHLSDGSYGLSPEDAQFILSVNHLPLTVVTIKDGRDEMQPALALTGGGMDLSWEICEAYCRIGQVPPMNFWDLPNMAGKGGSIDDLWVMECIRYGARWFVGRAQENVKRIEERIRWGKIIRRRRSEGKRPYHAKGGYIAFGNYQAAWDAFKAADPKPWFYELRHARETEFRTMFLCPTAESVAALKKEHKDVELASAQCGCTSEHMEEPPAVREDCPECQGKGQRPKCSECGRKCDYGETLCKYHKHIAQLDKEAADAK